MTFRKWAIIFYLLSLGMPIFVEVMILGFVALIEGLMALYFLLPWLGIPWIANIFFIINILYRGNKPKTRLILSLATLICASFAFGIESVPSMKEVVNVTLGIGFYVWYISFIALFIHDLKSYRLSYTR